MQLSRALILFFSLSSIFANAEDFVMDEESKAIAERGKNPTYSEPLEVPKNIHQEESRLHAENFTRSLKQNGPFSPTKKNDVLPTRVMIFVSWSLGDKVLNEMFREASLEQNNILVFRGVKDNKNISKSLKEIQRLAAKFNPVPHIIIDPTLYSKYDVVRVPTIIFLNESRTKEISRVVGMLDPKWLIADTNEGNVGDRGIKGLTFEISEMDLTEVMKQRVAGVDWEAKKDGAVNRFWSKQQFIPLQPAVVNKTKIVDPTVYVTADIKDAKGSIIVPKGTKINPLKLHSFSQAIVVFNPTIKGQRELVDRKLTVLRKKYSRITLIATNLETVKGWDAYKNLTDHFQAPVFKLTSDVAERFELEKTPSLITSEKFNFIVEEFAE